MEAMVAGDIIKDLGAAFSYFKPLILNPLPGLGHSLPYPIFAAPDLHTLAKEVFKI